MPSPSDWASHWHLTGLGSRSAEQHARRAYNVPPDVRLGWKPYRYLATRGAISQWACHSAAELRVELQRRGLELDTQTHMGSGMRAWRLKERAP